MIVPMYKYSIALHRDVYGDFLTALRNLGLVDITTTGWEPTEEDLQAMAEIEKYRQAVLAFKELRAESGFAEGKPYATGEKAFERYRRASAELDALRDRIDQARKEAEEIAVWGHFNKEKLDQLELAGIRLHYFSVFTKDFESNLHAWRSEYTLEEIRREKGMSYFVVIAAPDDQVSINAQELKAPDDTIEDKRAEITALEEERKQWEEQLARAAASEALVAAHGEELMERFRFTKVQRSGREEIEGSLLVLEGWATREDAPQVDALLDAHPDLIYLREKPTPEDETPVKLTNNRFARLFELIGGFYSMPKYGTTDLTPYFAPFYMIFFGFCLGDGGYGLIFLLAGIFLRRKGKTALFRQVGGLTVWLGASTMLFGLLTGSYFGIRFEELEIVQRLGIRFLDQMQLFVLALALGAVQILFGMVLKVIGRTRMFGFRYALSTIGWLIVLLTGFAYLLLTEVFGVENLALSSPFILVPIVAGALMMLFLNTPGKNPVVNFGKGLWNTYNDVVGIVGGVLSYIRLFAIGLSGGILATVFNMLATGLSPDIPVIKQLVMLIILLVGHGINLFMSSIGAFVHPMRLTFVEFFNNAGFEATERAFTPFGKTQKNEV